MNKRFTYKGYSTVLHYSEEDQCYHGRIDNIRDYIDYEGQTVAEAEQAFHEAVDEYITYLHDTGLDLV